MRSFPATPSSPIGAPSEAGGPRQSEHRRRERIEIATIIVSVALLIRVGLSVDPTDASASARGADTRATTAILSVMDGMTQSADARAPAVRSRVRATLPAGEVPPDVVAAIGPMVSTARGCTQTVLGDTTVTAAHCHQPTFSVEGDVAWKGPRPVWVDPAIIPIGATIYSIGYPVAEVGPQVFALSNLGPRTITFELQPLRVLMGVGDGVPCTAGASGMIAWVTIDNRMVPIGPMSVYSVDPAVTGLPKGQYVCGFAI
jgi:hypothetical protein